jgi:hypothetical protein
MGLEEARWMVQSWKQLKTVVGKFSLSDRHSMAESSLAVIFGQRGIAHMNIQYNSK